MKHTPHAFRLADAGAPHTRGSALIVTLTILVLVVILVVGVMTITRLERVSANSHLEGVRAKSLAHMGVDHATALIREACEAGSQSGHFWASQPGKITVFRADGTEDESLSRYLYSRNTGGTTVNINQAGFGGGAPIVSAAAAGTAQTPDMEVDWEPVLETPSSPAGSQNKMIGRYAFWVDDESAKLNVNTADGTAKSTDSSFGPGTPTEISLQALRQLKDLTLDTVPQAIARRSGARYDSAVKAWPFNDISEMLQVDGVTTDMVTDNDFNATVYSRTPELNLFGEPKINLLPVTGSAPENAMTGIYQYDGGDVLPQAISGGSLSQVYPVSSALSGANQLPSFTYQAYGASSGTTVGLPQFVHDYSSFVYGQKVTATSTDYDLGMRIARYLKGKNSRGEDIAWPRFPGSSNSGFAGKYTDRQIDSIALQILSMLNGAFVDHYKTFSLPPVMPKGFLSGQLVCGLSRGPRVNEIVVEITTMLASPAPKVAMTIYIEWYLPKEFEGIPLNRDNILMWAYGNSNLSTVLNFQDGVQINKATGALEGASPLGGYWMDNMLKFLDQNGDEAGVDLVGNDPSVADPDQSRAERFHNYPGAPRTSNGKLYGAGVASRDAGQTVQQKYCQMLGMYTPTGSYSPSQIWKPGEYRTSMNMASAFFFPTKEGVTAVKPSGGLAIGLHTQSGGPTAGQNIDPVPLDSLRGSFTGESLSNTTVRQAVLDAVIPMPDVTISVPDRVVIHFQVADPLVNKFPGDWVVTVNPPDSDITMTLPTGRSPTSYTTGQNTIAEPKNSGDPLSMWWPIQSVNVPKSQRFPSIGYLQYVRTGLMPDKATDTKPIRQQKGTPFRMLNFAPSTADSQKTEGGESYPDWAMLDLFTVPAVLQPVGKPAPAPAEFTWGGATAGRVNINSALVPFPSLSRTVPLEGVLKGISASTEYQASGDAAQATLDEAALAKAIDRHVASLGRPLMLPGEICNVLEVADYLYAGGKREVWSRNDVVRKVVGNLTTRSNTFAIWAVGQVIKKTPGHTDYGKYESGDAIVGETKLKVVVERTLDYGADGVPGNQNNPGPDGIVGTGDDPVDAVYHPTMSYPLPYKYRILSVREIAN